MIKLIKTLFSTLACAAFFPVSVQACTFGLQVRFTESAPVDRFEIIAKGAEPWQIKSLTFDLSKAVGNIIFDPTPSGAGVEAFAPFRETSNSAEVAEQPALADGDQVLTLTFDDFAPGQRYAFTVDIDDQLDSSDRGQIQVTGSELAEASISASVDRLVDYGAGRMTTYGGFFDANSELAKVEAADGALPDAPAHDVTELAGE